MSIIAAVWPRRPRAGRTKIARRAHLVPSHRRSVSIIFISKQNLNNIKKNVTIANYRSLISSNLTIGSFVFIFACTIRLVSSFLFIQLARSHGMFWNHLKYVFVLVTFWKLGLHLSVVHHAAAAALTNHSLHNLLNKSWLSPKESIQNLNPYINWHKSCFEGPAQVDPMTAWFSMKSINLC